jgi:paraquat-inducible protein A
VSDAAVTAREAGLVACTRCARVWARGSDVCTRCGSALHSRKPLSLQKVWGWWIAGLICYIPANLYPMLRTQTLLNSSENTIVGGAIDLIHHGAVAVALVVLVASVAIPVGKFIAIAYLALNLGDAAPLGAHRRQQLYELVEFIGRWSMIDVFVVAILSSLVQLNFVATIHPGPAALTFALSVIFTMLSAKSFDSRMIWDRAE